MILMTSFLHPKLFQAFPGLQRLEEFITSSELVLEENPNRNVDCHGPWRHVFPWRFYFWLQNETVSPRFSEVVPPSFANHGPSGNWWRLNRTTNIFCVTSADCSDKLPPVRLAILNSGRLRRYSGLGKNLVKIHLRHLVLRCHSIQTDKQWKIRAWYSDRKLPWRQSKRRKRYPLGS